MTGILHHMMHPSGWWIVLDIIVLGSSITLGIVMGNDD